MNSIIEYLNNIKNNQIDENFNVNFEKNDIHLYKNNKQIKIILEEILNKFKNKEDLISIYITSHCFCYLKNYNSVYELNNKFLKYCFKHIKINDIQEIYNDTIKNNDLKYYISYIINNLGYLYERI